MGLDLARDSGETGGFEGAWGRPDLLSSLCKEGAFRRTMNPVFLQIGDFQLRFLGLFWALGILAGYLLVQRDVKKAETQFDEDGLFDLIIFATIGAVIGARAYYVLLNWEFYSSSRVPWYEFALFWHGGMAVHGGLLGGILALWIAATMHGWSFGKAADLLAPGLLLAQAFGLLGNLMNGDAHGLPTDLPWGLVFHYGPAAKEFPGMALHPTMLYEMLLNLIAFGLLYSIRGQELKPGFVGAVYLILYGAIRFVMAFFRADELEWLGVKMAFPASALIALGGVAAIFVFKLYEEYKPAQRRETQYLPKRQWKL